MRLNFKIGMKVTVRLGVILKGFTWCKIEGDFEGIHLGFGDAGLLRNNPHMGPPFSQQHLSEIKLVLEFSFIPLYPCIVGVTFMWRGKNSILQIIPSGCAVRTGHCTICY